MAAAATDVHSAVGAVLSARRKPPARPTPAPVPTSVPTSAPGASGSAVVQSASGLTTLLVTPLVVRTHEQIIIRVHSYRLAGVLVTIAYPDGQSVVRRGRTTLGGEYLLQLPVVYEPLDRSAVASVTVSVAPRATGGAETVQTTFTVLRPSLLSGASLRVRPARVRTGQSLEVIVRAGLPYVQVHLTVLDPSQQSVSTDGSTDAAGTFVATIPVSYDTHGRSDAALLVTAVLSYEGQTRLLQQRVPLIGSR